MPKIYWWGVRGGSCVYGVGACVYDVGACVYGVGACVYSVGACVHGNPMILVSAPVPLGLIGFLQLLGLD